MSKRAAIYARVSTATQAEKGYSLPTQVEACRRYAEQHSLEVVAVVYDDESGAKLERAGLSRVREMFQAGAAEALIVYQADRLNRDYVHSILLGRELKRAGVEIHYAKRGTKAGETPEEAFVDNIEAVVAEFERQRIKERTMRGRRAKAEAGKLVGNGAAPFGYEKTGERGALQLAIVEQDARTVRQIFEWYARGDGPSGPLGVRTIVAKLNELGVASPGDRCHRNKARPYGQWSFHAVYELLGNPTYSGTAYSFRQKIVDGKRIARPKDEWVGIAVPAIISQDLWDPRSSACSLGSSSRLGTPNTTTSWRAG